MQLRRPKITHFLYSYTFRRSHTFTWNTYCLSVCSKCLADANSGHYISTLLAFLLVLYQLYTLELAQITTIIYKVEPLLIPYIPTNALELWSQCNSLPTSFFVPLLKFTVKMQIAGQSQLCTLSTRVELLQKRSIHPALYRATHMRQMHWNVTVHTVS